jgi:hypothetical protein
MQLCWRWQYCKLCIVIYTTGCRRQRLIKCVLNIEKERGRKYSRRVVKMESHVRSDRHISAGREKEHRLLEFVFSFQSSRFMYKSEISIQFLRCPRTRRPRQRPESRLWSLTANAAASRTADVISQPAACVSPLSATNSVAKRQLSSSARLSIYALTFC